MNAKELLIHNAQYLADDGMTFIDEMEYFDENQQEWFPLIDSHLVKTFCLKLRPKPKKTKKQNLIDNLCFFDDNMNLIKNVDFFVYGKWMDASDYYEYKHYALAIECPARINGS